VLEVTAADKGVLVVNELPLEDYLVGLINCEISSAWPMEAVKAVALATTQVDEHLHEFQLSQRAPWAHQRDATIVLLAAIIDDACTRGFKEVDFLRGDEPYKGRFAQDHREIVRLVVGTGIMGRLGGVAHAGVSQATQTAGRCVRFGRSTVARWGALRG
jgi:hypothetical protein